MDEWSKQTKSLLELYGSYARDIQRLKQRIEEIKLARNWHENWPKAAAHECGYYTTDPDHEAVNNMNIDLASLEIEKRKIEAMQKSLKLEAWLNSMSTDDRELIKLVFEQQMTQQEAAPRLNLSRSGIKHRINTIYKTRPAGR